MSSRHLARSFLLLTVLVLLGCSTGRPPASLLQHIKSQPEEAAWIRGVPCYTQRADHNGFASAASVLRFWDALPRRSEINALRAADFDQYAVLTNITAWVRDSGLWIHRASSTEDQLRERIRHGSPTLVYLQDSALDITSLRVAVVVGYDNVDRIWLCHDGRPTPSSYAYADFSRLWNNAFNGMLTWCPPEFPAWPLDTDELISRAQHYTIRGQFERAMADLELALVDMPLNDALHMQLGYLCHMMDNVIRAEALYRRALEINPHHASAYNNLAYLLAEQGRALDEAVDLAKQATYLDPSSAHALDTLGYVYFKQGSYAEAERYLERARGLAEGLPVEDRLEIALHLAWSYARSHQPHLARQVLADIRTMRPSFKTPPALAEALESKPLPME